MLVAESFGVKSIGIDGDINLKIFQKENFLLHDFTKGSIKIPYNDLAWSVEFLEHVE